MTTNNTTTTNTFAFSGLALSATVKEMQFAIEALNSAKTLVIDSRESAAVYISTVLDALHPFGLSKEVSEELTALAKHYEITRQDLDAVGGLDAHPAAQFKAKFVDSYASSYSDGLYLISLAKKDEDAELTPALLQSALQQLVNNATEYTGSLQNAADAIDPDAPFSAESLQDALSDIDYAGGVLVGAHYAKEAVEYAADKAGIAL